jgi:D-3-phosphoglycerate dehydrogenase / 2-oxoglutarate reductase
LVIPRLDRIAVGGHPILRLNMEDALGISATRPYDKPRDAWPNILVTDDLAPAGLAVLGRTANVTYAPDISPESLAATIARYEGLIVRSRTRVTAELIRAAIRLRVIGRAGVGLDSIDVKAARARGIIVLSTPLAATVAVAELTMGLMLSLARAIPAADATLKKGEWQKYQLVGSELNGKTLGIIGLGRIGTVVAARARAFGMQVKAFDPNLTSALVRQRGAEPGELNEILAQADYLSIHVPLTDDTWAMLGPKELAQMKDGARLICCARGCIVDEEALADALDSGRLAGAALDVFATEPPAFARLVQHPQVIATPHIGAMTREAQEKAAFDIAEQVSKVLQAG